MQHTKTVVIVGIATDLHKVHRSDLVSNPDTLIHVRVGVPPILSAVNRWLVHVKVTSAIAVRISAQCAVDKSGKQNRYGGDSAAEGLTIFQSYAIYTCR